MARRFLLLGALNGLLSVAFGAFGAHALRDRLPDGLFQVFQTAVQYQGLHALALLAAGGLALRHRSRLLGWSGGLFAAGILLFSGSLYLLALTGLRPLGLITPFGGVALLAGWLGLAAAVWRLPKADG